MTDLEREVRLIQHLLQTQKKTVVDNFLPKLERLINDVHRMKKNGHMVDARLDMLETACADIAAAVYETRTGKDIRNNVRAN